MIRKIAVEVKNNKEAEAVKRALADPGTLALVKTIGMLLPLPPRAQTRVLNFVMDKLEENRP